MNILIVEDNLLCWEKLAQFLRSEEYSLHLAKTPLEAFTYSSEADLIMVNAEFSSGGVDLSRELRSRGYSRPLILLAIESLDDVLRAEADDWLEAPFHRQEVLLKVKLLLMRYYMWNLNTTPRLSERLSKYGQYN